jgi:hypothetical protein
MTPKHATSPAPPAESCDGPIVQILFCTLALLGSLWLCGYVSTACRQMVEDSLRSCECLEDGAMHDLTFGVTLMVLGVVGILLFLLLGKRDINRLFTAIQAASPTTVSRWKGISRVVWLLLCGAVIQINGSLLWTYVLWAWKSRTLLIHFDAAAVLLSVLFSLTGALFAIFFHLGNLTIRKMFSRL